MRYDLKKRVCAGEVPPAASSKRGTCTLKHIFIINPSAGKNDSRQRIYTMAEALREKHGLDVQCMLTASVGHAATLARGLAESGEDVRLYACGGDGADYEKFLDAENLWNGETQALDLIDCSGRYCLTIACSGIDARIAESVHKFSANPHLSGRGSYLVSVAANGIFGRIGRHWTVWLDEERIEDDFALVSMCNGRYYGGGSTPVPEARMNDGVLHTVLVKNISKLRFARLFPDYSAGNHEKLPKDVVRFSTAKVVRIHSDDGDIVTCLDGECSHSHDVTLRLADKKLNFFGPAGCDPNATAR